MKTQNQTMLSENTLTSRPTDIIAGFPVRPGFFELNGATPLSNGVNFTTHTRHGTSCELLLFHSGEEEPFAVLPFPNACRIGDVYSMIVMGLDIEDLEYGYRIDGPYEPEKGHIFDKTKVLLDPYAKAVAGQREWGQQKIGSYHARVVRDSFDWEDMPQSTRKISDLIIYELHVRGFTQDASSGVTHPGTFAGLREKIPYLKELGINAIYLNPIFSGTSNHRYDTNDYLKIDSMLGRQEDFEELIQLLHQEKMHLILDGVFSHVGKNSLYFNINGDYGDDEGAAKNPDSPYFDWFKFENYPFEYKSWWGIKDLPEIDKDNDSFRNFIYGEKNSVLAKWNALGIDGWRLDVADELPDSFIKGIRENLDSYSDKILIGEIWEDASNKISYGKRRNYILGGSLQAAMNYPFRDLIINLLNGHRSSQDVAHQLMTLQENYPKDIFYNNLNNLGTHDTERILTMVGEKNLSVALAMLFVLPGIPCIYYGDEAGLSGGKDPENRKYFPWDNISPNVYNVYKSWTQKRLSENSLKYGEFSTFFTDRLLGILRYTDSEVFVELINPSEDELNIEVQEITFLQNLKFLPELKKLLTEKVISGKTNLELKMKI